MMDEKIQKEAEGQGIPAEEKAKAEGSENSEEQGAEGKKYETTPIIERARVEREKMEVIVKELRTENDRREQIMAKRALGGESEAGQTPVKKSEDEKWAEDAKKRYEGTGMSPVEDDDGK